MPSQHLLIGQVFCRCCHVRCLKVTEGGHQNRLSEKVGEIREVQSMAQSFVSGYVKKFLERLGPIGSHPGAGIRGDS